MASQTGMTVGADALPDRLPPFEVAAALARLNGDRALLRRLIVGFAARFAAAADQMRGLVRAQDWSTAERLAHSVKGGAAQIEARALVGAADALEQACHARQTTELPTLVETFGSRLAAALAAARTLPHAPAPPMPSPAPAGAPAGALAAELRRLLGANNLRARAGFAALSAALAGSGQDDALARLGAAIDRLDFAEALRRLDALATDDAARKCAR
jgi:two-component system sensor histidine kinase/response regulator